MRFRLNLFAVLCLLTSMLLFTGCKTQAVSDYKWNQPVLILITDDVNSPAFKGQIALLDGQSKTLEQKNVLVFLVGPKYYRIGLEDEMRTSSVEFFNHFNDPMEPYELLLVDPDGNIELRDTKIYTPQELYYLIDEMALKDQGYDSEE